MPVLVGGTIACGKLTGSEGPALTRPNPVGRAAVSFRLRLPPCDATGNAKEPDDGLNDAPDHEWTVLPSDHFFPLRECPWRLVSRQQTLPIKASG